MTKRGLNLYELIFGAFFVLKVAKLTVVADWSWWWIFAPFIVNLIHKFFSWIWYGTGLTNDLNEALLNLYIARKEKVFYKNAIKEQRERLSRKNRSV